MPEPDDGKLSSPVLRGGWRSNALSLPSDLRYINQLGGGPALGLWQMEPATHDDIWENFLAYRVKLGLKVLGSQTKFNHTRLIWDLAYACAMSRIHYLRVPRALPRAGNIKAQARYYKQFYNTPAGKGTVEQYLANWHRTVGQTNANNSLGK